MVVTDWLAEPYPSGRSVNSHFPTTDELKELNQWMRLNQGFQSDLHRWVVFLEGWRWGVHA